MEVLTSPSNPRVKLWASLKERKYRERTGLYLVEGVRSIETYLEAGIAFDAVVLDAYSARSDALFELADRCEERDIDVIEVSSSVFSQIADTEHSQGIIAVVKKTEGNLADLFSSPHDAALAQGNCSDVILVADQIRDPGNLGTMIRTADAVMARGVVVTSGSVDVFNPKVVRASMGSLAHVSMARGSVDAVITACKDTGYRIVCADAHAEHSLFNVALVGPTVLVIGGETQGVSAQWKAAGADVVHLPMPGQTESLNAGMATSVILYEALRQRGTKR